MEALLSALIARLDTLTLTGVPTSKLDYIDVDWGQLDNYDRQPPVKFPCALLDIRALNYSNTGNLGQIGIIDVEVRLADLILSNSSAGAPATQKAQAMRIFRLTEAVFKHLHGWETPALPNPQSPIPQLFGPLTRLSATRTKRTDGIKEMRMVFRAQLVEMGAHRTPQTVTIIPPNIP
jgi:hypothetical protein